MSARYDYIVGLQGTKLARVRRECRQSIGLAFAGRHNQPRRARIVVSQNVRTLREIGLVHDA